MAFKWPWAARPARIGGRRRADQRKGRAHFKCPGRWRELLAGAGVQRAAVSGSGIFKDAQSDETIRARFFAGEIGDWQLAIPGFGVVSGPFQITSLEYTGNHDGEVTFEMALESAGAISFAVTP